MDSSNNENLSPHELDHLHSLLGRLRSQHGAAMTVASTPSQQPPAAAAELEHTHSMPPPSQIQQWVVQPAITAYVPHTQPSILPSIPTYQTARLSGSLAPSSSSSVSGLGLGFPSLSQPQRPMAPIQQQSDQGTLSQHRAPFLGFQGNTSQANQQRLASASNSLPRRPSLPTRATGVARCPRGRAGRPPSLSTGPTIQDVLVHDIATNSNSMRIRVKIYPPLGEYGVDYFVYRFHRDSFNEALRSKHLLFDADFQISSTVADVMQFAVAKMQESPFMYSFGDREQDSRVLPHEALPLGLLRLVNRGRARPSTNQIRLQPQPMMNGITLEAMTTDHASLFVSSDISFEDRRFVISLVIMTETLVARLPSNGEGERHRRHTCIPQSLWIRFPQDRSNNEIDSHDTSGGETETDGNQGDSDSDDDMVSRPSNRAISAVPRPRTGLRLGLRSTNIPESSVTVPASNSVALPPELWSTPWVIPLTEAEVIDLSNLDTSLFERASSFRPPKLAISGKTVLDLADRLVEEIGAALDHQDFEKILSFDREFLITRTSPEGRRQIRSLGRGIECEAVHLAYNHYSSQPSQWFLPRAGGYSSIAVTHSMNSGAVSKARLRELSILGALTGLMLVYGMTPEPLSPVLIHFFIHDCNPKSIYSSFLAEWLPDIHRTLKDWLALDHTSDISSFQPHFSTYHDLQIACLRDRDAASHKAMAPEMLYRAIIGPEHHTHCEIQAFLRGFKMRCQRTGFDLTKIKTLVEGGSEAFLNMVWTSHIKAYDDISPHLRFPDPSEGVLSQLDEALSSYTDLTFEKLFRNFLAGSGIPCPQLFENALKHLDCMVDLSKIDHPGFRSRIFHWAATGSPSLEINGEGISISVCGPLDEDYAPASHRDAMMREGAICFKTCFSQIKVPAPYIGRLAGAVYTPGVEPTSLQAAFDHWLLCEFLNVLGDHSIL